MKLREWLAVEYGGPGRRRAAVALWLRDTSDSLAGGEPGVLRWRWRSSLFVRWLYRATWRRA